MLKNILCLLVFIPFFIACGEKTNSNAPTIAFLDAFEDATIAQAKEGFFDALQKEGFSKEDKTLNIIYRNAQGDIPTLTQAVDYAISQQVDIIATNPTISTITTVQKTKDIPVCMMVSPTPEQAGLTQGGKAPPNLFGVYETLDYISTSVQMIKKLKPSVKKLGVIYNQAEPQSVNALKVIRKAAKANNIKVEAMPVNNSSETQLITESLANKGIDAFFAMPDNVVFASFEVIYKTCQAANIPVFTSEEGLVKRGAVAAYGADMYQWGYQAGIQAATFLKNKKAEIPALQKVQTHKKVYNDQEIKEFKITPDDSFEKVK